MDSPFTWRAFLAPFHSVILHYPIGFYTLVCLLELYQFWRPSADLRRFTRWLLAASLLITLLTGALGYARASGAEYEAGTLEEHRLLGILVAVLGLFSMASEWYASRKCDCGIWQWVYRGVLALTFAALVAAGHLGGNLTHGANYLTRNAPPALRDWLEGKPGPVVATATPNTTGTVPGPSTSVFATQIQPILEKKCLKCHGAEKHKGGYRLDQRELALKAGESERPGLVPGKPLESEVVRLILLPPDHDNVMPPAGKDSLTPEEIVKLVRWIGDGAP